MVSYVYGCTHEYGTVCSTLYLSHAFLIFCFCFCFLCCFFVIFATLVSHDGLQVMGCTRVKWMRNWIPQLVVESLSCLSHQFSLPNLFFFLFFFLGFVFFLVIFREWFFLFASCRWKWVISIEPPHGVLCLWLYAWVLWKRTREWRRAGGFVL